MICPHDLCVLKYGQSSLRVISLELTHTGNFDIVNEHSKIYDAYMLNGIE